MVKENWNLISKFDFGIERERERERERDYLVCGNVKDWMVNIDNPLCGRETKKNWNLKSLWEIDLNDNLMHSYNFIFV